MSASAGVGAIVKAPSAIAARTSKWSEPMIRKGMLAKLINLTLRTVLSRECSENTAAARHRPRDRTSLLHGLFCRIARRRIAPPFQVSHLEYPVACLMLGGQDCCRGADFRSIRPPSERKSKATSALPSCKKAETWYSEVHRGYQVSQE